MMHEATIIATIFLLPFAIGYTTKSIAFWRINKLHSSTKLGIKPPADSVWEKEERNVLPSGYDPLLEYPGTMRPSKVRENSPFEDLPLSETIAEIEDEDKDTVTFASTEVEAGGMGVNVPWPHFQDIPWHISWGAANDGGVEMEEFIQGLGRWLTPEEEEELMKGRRKQKSPKGSEANVVVIDDDEEDEVGVDLVEEGNEVEAVLGEVDALDDANEEEDDDDDDDDDAEDDVDRDEDDEEDDDEDEDDDTDDDDGEDGLGLDDLLGF